MPQFSDVNFDVNYVGKNPTFVLGKQYDITMQRFKENGLYFYEIIIDGVSFYKIESKPFKTYPEVKLYVSDPWYDPFSSDLGTVSNFKVHQG